MRADTRPLKLNEVLGAHLMAKKEGRSLVFFSSDRAILRRDKKTELHSEIRSIVGVAFEHPNVSVMYAPSVMPGEIQVERIGGALKFFA